MPIGVTLSADGRRTGAPWVYGTQRSAAHQEHFGRLQGEFSRARTLASLLARTLQPQAFATGRRTCRTKSVRLSQRPTDRSSRAAHVSPPELGRIVARPPVLLNPISRLRKEAGVALEVWSRRQSMLVFGAMVSTNSRLRAASYHVTTTGTQNILRKARVTQVSGGHSAAHSKLGITTSRVP